MPMDSNIFQELKKMVAIASEAPHEQKMGEYVYSILGSSGYAVEKQYIDDHRFNVIAEKGTGTTSIVLYAHLDTVTKASGWKTDPYCLVEKKKKAYGLGAWDMKGGLLANILAFQNCNPKHIKLIVVFCVDEEYISRGGHALMKMPFMKDVSCVISTEPAFHHGLQGIVTGRIGRSVFDVIISSKSNHYAFYDPQIDMNCALADFIVGVQKLYKKRGDKKQFVFARSIVSRTIGMSLPERIEIELDSSILPPNTHTSVLSFLKKVARSIERKYRSYFSFSVQTHKRDTPFLEPYEIDNQNCYVGLLKKSVKTVTKKRAVPYFRSSVADENIFGSKGIITLGIGPQGGNAHSANEWVDIHSIQNLVSILENFISQVDKNE